MLTNKKLISTLIFLCILCAGLVYWYYPFKPKSFYSESTIKKLISETYEGEFVEKIQAIQFINKTHVFVPYISKDKNYGLSFWKWEHHKWKVVNIVDKGGSPHIWKIEPSDPSSYAIFWNYHPEDYVDKLKFRLVQKRGFYSSEEKNIYTPLINLEKIYNVKNKTYGYIKYPSEWYELLKLETKVGVRDRSILFAQNNINTGFYISWAAFLKDGKETFPENSVNGNSFLVSNKEVFDYVLIESDNEIQ